MQIGEGEDLSENRVLAGWNRSQVFGRREPSAHLAESEWHCGK
jgi:hypothetical protein